MIDMTTWGELRLDVLDDIYLDPRNVRLEVTDEVPEADIVHDLFANEKAFTVLESIVKVGWLTHELPVVVYRNGKYVAVEGNRRIAALKAIQNPFLAPDHQARIHKLVDGWALRDAVKTITVKRAPSQDEADQLIAAIHTGTQRVPWTPSRQAAFFQAQIDAGKTIQQLYEQYPTVNVKHFVVRSQILALFRSANYSDPELTDYVRKRRFPVSTLARLYDYDRFLMLAGIHVDEVHTHVSLETSHARFSQLAEKIVKDIKSGRINTRVLNSTKSERYTDYMDELKDLLDELDDQETGEEGREPDSQEARTYSSSPASDTRKTGPSTTSTNQPEDGPAGSHGPQEDAEGSQKTRHRSSHLDTQTIEIPEGFPGTVDVIFREVSEINVSRFPNATMDLLRTFLEKIIKAYAESKGDDIRATKHSGQGYVYLSDCLVWLEEHLKATGKTAYIQVVQKIRTGKFSGYTPSMNHMNAINHNHHIFATPDEVRDAWATMRSLIQVIVQS